MTAAEKILLALSSGPKTGQNLRHSIDCCPRAIDYALQKLMKKKDIRRRPYLPDMRTHVYVLNHTEDGM